MTENKNRLGVCCFFGHRKIKQSQGLNDKLQRIIEDLVVKEHVRSFLFGSKSEFNNLCYHIVTKLKVKYPVIKRIYVRAEYPNINDDYKNYLLQYYEDTYFPEQISKAGKAVYIERNYEMIDKSSFCVVYYDNSYIPQKSRPKNSLGDHPKSGTKTAYEYALKKGVYIINILEN